jgi:hypothetical protein
LQFVVSRQKSNEIMLEIEKFKKREEFIFRLIGFLLILVYMFPCFILGEQSFLHVHDNLDANAIWFHMFSNFEDSSARLLN